MTDRLLLAEDELESSQEWARSRDRDMPIAYVTAPLARAVRLLVDEVRDLRAEVERLRGDER